MSLERITPRERQVLAGVCQGKTLKGIARDMGISENTVKDRMKMLYAKSQTNNRVLLVRMALDMGFA